MAPGLQRRDRTNRTADTRSSSVELRWRRHSSRPRGANASLPSNTRNRRLLARRLRREPSKRRRRPRLHHLSLDQHRDNLPRRQAKRAMVQSLE